MTEASSRVHATEPDGSDRGGTKKETEAPADDAPPPRWQRLSLAASRLTISLCGIIAILGLSGWATGSVLLTRVSPAFPPIVPVSAMALVLASIAHGLLASNGSRRIVTIRAGQVAASLVIALGLLGIFEYALALHGLKERMVVMPFLLQSGRSSLQTAVALVAAGAALLLLRVRSSRSIQPSDYAAMLAGGDGLIGLASYLYKEVPSYGAPGAPLAPAMSLPTALALVLLSASIIMARPTSGLGAVVLSPYLGGTVTRRLLLVGAIFPAFGLLVMLGFQGGFYEAGLAASLITTGGLVVGLGLVIRMGLKLNQLDKERRRASYPQLRLAAIVESSSDAIMSATPEGVGLTWNRAAERIYGYSASEILGDRETAMRVVPPERRGEIEALLAKLRQGERVEGYETERVRKNGERFHASVTLSPMLDAGGQMVGISSIVRDISERKQLEKSLQESRADLNRAQSVAKTGSWRLDAGCNEVQWSDETYRIFGASPGTPLTYASFLAHVHPDDRAYVDTKWSAALRGEPYDIEHRIVVGDRVKWVREKAELEFDDRGSPRWGIGVVQDITAQKAAAEEQRLWKERLSSIISIASDAIISIDDEHRIVVYNEGAEVIFGWSAEEVLGEPIGVLLPERLRAIHDQHIKGFRAEAVKSRVMGERRPVLVGLRKTGEEFPAEAAISKFELGGTRTFTVMLRDISERRRMEEALRVSEERLKVSLLASPAVVFNQDLQLKYTWIHNPRPPITAAQVLGKTDFDLFPLADAEEFTRIKRASLETGKGVRGVVRATIQSEVFYYDLTVEPLRDSDDRIVGITCAAWDVTDQRRHEDEQRFLAEFGAALMITAPNYDATLAELARLVLREFADWFVVDILGDGLLQRRTFACSDPTKRDVATAIAGVLLDRRRPHLMFEALEGRRATLVTEVTPAYVESIAQSPEHLELLRALDMRSLIAVPLLSSGRLLGAFAFISSREPRRYNQRDLRFAEDVAHVAALAVENAQLYQSTQRAIAARDDVLGIVAHDLRSPLNSVLLHTEVLRRSGLPAGRSGESSANAIRRSALHMNRLIQDMLDVARLEGGSLALERAAVSPRSLLDEVLQMQSEEASNAGLNLWLDAREGLPSASADRVRLLQVFGNLVGNAMKFTAKGGDIFIGAKPSAGEMVFWVKDTGSGIPQEHLGQLFDRFWQAKKTDRRGAGLGLSIVKGIIEAHGGRIWVESEVGKGTTFYFTVPLVEPRAGE